MYRQPIMRAVNIPDEQAVSIGISKEILPQNYHREKEYENILPMTIGSLQQILTITFNF